MLDDSSLHPAAFISYGQLDNESVNEDEHGWISSFHNALERRLSQYLGTTTKIWRDDQLDRTEPFDVQIRRILAATPNFIAIVSPRFVKSKWCQHESKIFLKALQESSGSRDGTRLRIFKVVNTWEEVT